MNLKRERDEGDGDAVGDDHSAAAVAVTLPRKLQRVLSDDLSPVSPTVAAGVLPRSTVYALPSPPPTPQESAPKDLTTAHTSLAAPVATPAAVNPIQALDAIRDCLALTTDAHLQAKLLLQFSHVAISPGAPTNSAIDFLFSFLQQNQGAAVNASTDGKSERESGAQTVSRTAGGPVVVGAIVRGLRKLLAVKAKVVEPMIQVDAMGEQLMQCMSVAEDFKLRQDMMQIVVDCLMITRAYAQVETLLSTCVHDHDPAMQAICLQGYLRLHDAGYRFDTEPAKLFDLASTMLLHGGGGGDQKKVKLWAARLVTALSELHPLLKVASKFFPGPGSTMSSSSMPSTLRDKAFYVLCMGADDASASIRKEIVLCLRSFAEVPMHVVEHALQKTQISEELAKDTDMNTVLMLSTGKLLDLLEDKSDEVPTEASRTIRYLTKSAKWSEQTLDRTISAHVDLLPTASASKAQFQTLVETLRQLLKQRKEQFKVEFSLASEEVNYILRDETVRADTSAMLSLLSVLIQCDTSSVWMVQRIVKYTLLIAEAVVSHTVAAVVVENGAQHKHQLLALTKSIQLKCGATIQMDVALVDKLNEEANQQQQMNNVKEEVCSILLNKDGKESVPSDRGSGSRSLSTLFKFTQTGISPRDEPSKKDQRGGHGELSEYSKLLKLPLGEQILTSRLKSIQHLRATAGGTTEASGLRIVELVLQLRQHLKSLPDATATKSSSYVSMDAMLGNNSSRDNNNNNNNEKKLREFSRVTLSGVLVRGCEEIVTLAGELYVKENGLSCHPRAELLQIILLARVGLVINRLQSMNSGDDQIAAHLQWLAEEASQLRFLQNKETGATLWFSAKSFRDMVSLNELKRELVNIVRKAWPAALLQALSVLHSQSSSRTTSAVIYEPEANSKEPREIVALWPFTVRVRSLVENLNDVTRVFIKSILPNGDIEYHHVPVHSISTTNPSSYLIDHSIKLTISPFSDPTSYSVALCVQHPALPGAVEMEQTAGDSRSQVAYTDISEAVKSRVFHRTNSTIRRG